MKFRRSTERQRGGRAAADCGHGKFEIPVHVRRSLARSVSLDSAPPNRTNECGRDDRPQKISRGRTNGRVRRRCRGFTPPATLARRLNNHDAMPATQKQASLHRLTDGRNEDRMREEQEDFIFKWTESPRECFNICNRKQRWSFRRRQPTSSPTHHFPRAITRMFDCCMQRKWETAVAAARQLQRHRMQAGGRLAQVPRRRPATDGRGRTAR